MKKTRQILSFLLLTIILLSNISPIFAKSISQSEKVNLVFDHDCVSVLKVKGKDELKQVAYVVYRDPDTGIKYPAFCVQPEKEGIGTGAGNSYDVTISSLNDPVLWRMLYKGYVGSSYRSWGLSYDDDLYFATKTAIHCYKDGSTPKGKYEIPNRVGRGDENRATLAEIQSRGAKVLEVAEQIYNYGLNGSDNYIKAVVTATTSGSITEETIDGLKYLVQKYSVTANKELSSYKVQIASFPEGTRILNSNNKDSTEMTNSVLKIAIPIKEVKENFTGYINIVDAKVKSYPIFFGDSGNNDTQSYVFTDPSEVTTARATINIDAYKSTLKIVKKDDEQKPVQGATFNLKYEDGTNIGNYTTDNNGSITVSKLKQGNVIVTEKEVPGAYVLDSSSKYVYLDYNSTSNLEVTNALKRGNLKVIKVDQDNNEIKIPNVEFQLLDSNKREVGRYITDQNGELHVEGLKIGKYTLKEVKENPNYYPLESDIKIEIKWNETTTTKVENEHLKGKIRVVKVDSDYHDIKIENVVFEVIDSNNNVVETIRTSSNGEATTSRLNIGTYRLREVSTGDEYILDEGNKRVTVEKDKTTEVVIENLHKKGNVKVYKVDKDNHKVALGNVKFDLYSEEFSKIIGTYTTDVNGEIYIENLRTGNYKLIEKETNQWYNLSEDTNIKIEWDLTKNTIIENELKKGQIKVIKIDKDNNEVKLQGVKFEVLDSKGNVLETITTNENGEALTSRYSVRDYDLLTLREVETNEFYVLNEEPQTVVLEANQIKTITFENELKKGQIQVIKVDKDNRAVVLEGIKFNVLDESKNIVDTLTTDKNGQATSKRLPINQKYTIVETQTKKEYKLTEETKTVVLKQDEIKGVVFENELKKGQIRIIKIDKDNNEVRLPGVTFEILDSNMNVIEEIVTDVNGEAVSSRLPCVNKEYFIREKETLDTYVLNEETQKIVLQEDQIKDITFENERKKGYIEIKKVDKENPEKTLAGAEFEVYDQDENLVDTIIIGEDGIGTSKLLVSGKYTLKESKTGSVYYLLNEESYIVQIKENKEIVKITIDNEGVDIEVDVDKEGPAETKSGETIEYNFSNIKNCSNVFLEDFRWYDYLPTDYVRLTKVYTGTWNQKLTYNVYYKTNLSEEYILLEEGLDTEQNYELDFENLELQEDEYVTEFYFDFGKVDIGFMESEAPKVFCRVLDNLENGTTFTNKTETVGNYYGIEARTDSKTTTVVYEPEKEHEETLPRTGM